MTRIRDFKGPPFDFGAVQIAVSPMQSGESLLQSAEPPVQGRESPVQNAESPAQSAESLMPTPQCRFSDVECRMQSAAEIRVFPGPPPDSRLGHRGKKLGNSRILGL